MCVQYSDLCDRSVVAYQSYLLATCVVAKYGNRPVVELGSADGRVASVDGGLCSGNVGAHTVGGADVGEVCGGRTGAASLCEFGQSIMAVTSQDGFTYSSAGSECVGGTAALVGGSVGATVGRDCGNGHSQYRSYVCVLGDGRASGHESGSVAAGGVSSDGQYAGAKGDDDDVGVRQRVVVEPSVDRESVVRGKHYAKNRAKKEKKKLMSSNWRKSDDVASVAPTVCTVDTRTAVEVEAAQTLAARRVAENRVAVALAEHKLRALKDKDRTVMVDRLAAARGEQRINEAKEKSQASFKKCDQSLKSLGSSGSAGEFALKQEVKRAKDNEALRLYVEKQAQLLAKYATPDVLQMVAAIPAPVLQDEFEAFGECPSEYGEDEQEAYFDELNRRNEENFDRCATYC